MLLPGFKFSTCVGWLSGVIFTSNPTKLTEFRSWITPYTLYALVINLAPIVFGIDFILNVVPKVAVTVTRKNNSIARTAIQGFMTSGIVSLFIQRIYLVYNAKTVCSFLRSIKNNSAHGSTECTQQGKGRIGWAIIICLILMMVDSGLLTATALYLDRSSGWFYFLDDISFGVVVVFLAVLPNIVTALVTFALVSSTTHRLLEIFINFCMEVETTIATGKGITRLLDLDYTERLKMGTKVAVDTVEEMWGRSRHRYLQQSFRDIQGLFVRFDRVFGPLILLVIFSSTMSIIQGLNNILNESENASSIRFRSQPWVSAGYHVLFLLVLDLGYKSQEMIGNRKHALRDILFAAASKHKINPELENLVVSITSWQWSMSASGFFIVDRSLMGGIISTVMTYIVILFQLQE